MYRKYKHPSHPFTSPVPGEEYALTEQATKKDVAEVARVLALHVAHYRRRFGDIPVDELLELFRIEKLDDETAGNLADGFEVLVEVLKALGTPEGAH